MRIVALIPARYGSKRVRGKCWKDLGGRPLIGYTLEAAHKSQCFDRIIVATDHPGHDSGVYWTEYGNYDIFHRDEVPDDQPDIVWVKQVLEHVECDAFAILRPTSPFRRHDTIWRAYEQFKTAKCSSLRAVERVKQHPGKMWQWPTGEREMKPLIGSAWPSYYPAEFHAGTTPWHSQPTQKLPTVYVQNSSLEIAWRWCVDIFGTISGPKVAPFFTTGDEGFSIDYPEDWARAEQMVAALQAPPAA